MDIAHLYKDIISMENLLASWKEFIKGKRKKKDVQLFMVDLAENIFSLHEDLVKKTYTHGTYKHFRVMDPKLRDIHKASVRDRILHHAMYRILYPFFDKHFVSDSFSCRNRKGTHRAINRFRYFFRKVSKNNTKTCWILKCDIKNFFASIDHKILLEIFKKYRLDWDTMWLLEKIIESFFSAERGKGLPLGNATSQILVNIYMHEFDHYVKHTLKQKYYIRYADDFVVLGNNRAELEELLEKFVDFQKNNLQLTLHPNKILLDSLSSGVDFLGWIHFFDHRVIRTATKRRMLKKIALAQELKKTEMINSYIGHLKHGNTCKLREKITLLLQGAS